MREMLVNKQSDVKDLAYSIYSINDEDLEVWIRVGMASMKIPSDYFYDVLAMLNSIQDDIDVILKEDTSE